MVQCLKESLETIVIARWEKAALSYLHRSQRTNIAFLFVVARPRWDASRGIWFDRKVGSWLLQEKVTENRLGRYRSVETPEIQSYSATEESCRKHFVNSVIHKGQDKFLRLRPYEIVVQHDNAAPHDSAEGDGVSAACHNVCTSEIFLSLQTV